MAALAAGPALAQPTQAPWSAPSRKPITQTRLAVQNDAAHLSGTLHAPASERPVPAVVVLHGDDARKTDFDLLSSDGVAAFRALAADRRIDASQIGFWGLTQGGWLPLLAAAREPRATAPIIR